MYPRVNFDLPILSMDIVANQGRVSLAVVDPCPVTPNLELPPFYEQPVRWVGAADRLCMYATACMCATAYRHAPLAAEGAQAGACVRAGCPACVAGCDLVPTPCWEPPGQRGTAGRCWPGPLPSSSPLRRAARS